MASLTKALALSSLAVVAVDGFQGYSALFASPRLSIGGKVTGRGKGNMVSRVSMMASTIEGEAMNWWEAPKRIVETDNGMRARGIYYWLLDEHKVDMSKIDLRQSPVEGLGCFVNRDMEAGEPLFDIPRSCTIYPELVFADRGLGSSMQKLASASGTGVEVVALATFLAKERLRGSESSFRPYIECLPWDALHPLMWTDDEVDLLEGTYAHDEILQLREQVDTATSIFEPVLNPKGWKQLFQPIDSGNLDSDAFAFLMRGAFASVMSRAFDCDLGNRDGKGALEQRVLVPLLDIFNHDGNGPTITFDATSTGGIQIPVAISNKGGVSQGDELKGFYGAKPNWNLLTSYGFVSDSAISQESTLTARLDPSDPLFGKKRDALLKMGLSPEEQLLDIQASKPPSPKLMAYMRIAAAESESELSGNAMGEISGTNEAAAKAMLGSLAESRRRWIEQRKGVAMQAAKNGLETGVRRDVANLVCKLLDSEAAALDTLSPVLA